MFKRIKGGFLDTHLKSIDDDRLDYLIKNNKDKKAKLTFRVEKKRRARSKKWKS